MTCALTVVTLLLSPASASASSTAPSPRGSASPGAVVYRLGTLEDVDNLNPFIGYSGIDYLIYHLNYDFLVGFDPARLQTRPEFAESWTRSLDGRVWTFKIRPGMTWRDGQPATARDVAFTFNYIMKNDLTAFTSYLALIKKVTALDDTTVQFVCSQPKADILEMKVPILPEHIWSRISGQAAGTSFTNGPPCIGSGPYQLVEYKHNSYARLEANEHYWRGRPHVDELFIETYQNADTMVQDLKSGALDGVVGVLPAEFSSLGMPGITKNASTAWSFEQITFNCYTGRASTGNKVLLDPAFRQALQYAVDRQRNAVVAFNGYLQPGAGLLPPYSQYYWQPPGGQAYTYDPAKANAMLDAAGYKDVNGDGYRETKQGKALSLRVYTDSTNPQNITTSKLVVAWCKQVGVRVQLTVLDPGMLQADETNHVGKAFAPDFDMIVWWWEGDAESPQFILSLLTSGQIGGWSDTSWTDPQYERLFNQESTAVDHQTRVALAQQLQQIAYQASPYVILGYPEFLEAYNTARWQGYVKEPSAYPGYSGDAFHYDTFLDLRLVVAATGHRHGVAVWVYVLPVVVVALAIGAVGLRRRHPQETEQED